MEGEKKKHSILRPIKIGFNIILLTALVIIGVQNAQSVHMSILFWSGDIPLTLLVFLAGLLGGLVVLMINLIKWKS
jgi:uncharacterized integral membrane protein